MMMKPLPVALVASLALGCTTPAPPAATVTPLPEPTVAAPAPSVARADALLEDMRRREAAYQKLEREAPTPPTPKELMARAQASAPTASAPISVATPTITAPVQDAPAPTVAPERGEAWWKDRMRVLKARLDEDRFQLAGAERQASSTTLKLTYDQATAETNRLRAAVAADISAIESLELEARRAGIPSGWLRP